MRREELSLPRRRRRKRRGRGNASGRGTYSGRGMKGQKARAGGRIRPGFEGGQTPLYRRLPKARGGTAARAERAVPVNVDDLGRRFPAGARVDRAALVRAGLVPRTARRIKILGRGEIATALTVALPISSGAREKIERAGGSVEGTA